MTRHIALMVLVLFGLVGFWILDDYGVALDTGAQRSITIGNIDYLMGKHDDSVFSGHNRFYGVSYELPLLLLERALGLEDTRDVHLMRHLVTHLFFLAGGFFCYLLACRLFGSRLLALFTMLLFLLHPRIYAHSFFNSKDVPFLSLSMICLYLAHRAFGNGGVWHFLVLGVAIGVLVNLRIMGLALFFGVVALRVLDVFQASDVGERKRVLGSIGVFVLSAVAVIYAISPYLWGGPVVGFVEWFAAFSQHPSPVDHMFRGDVIVSTIVNPPEYVSAWMFITTPPIFLVLGVGGMCLVLLRGLFNPRDVWSNTRLRFWLMLVGCFVLPILAVIALSSNVYHGWRQMYFIYAPFCLLTVFGLHQMVLACRGLRLSALSRLFDDKILVYGVVIASTTVAVVGMFSLHPHQHLYFNFLVDRTTPGHLRLQYEMDYWLVTFREGYEQLLNRHPHASLHVHLPHAPSVKLNWEILPKEDRERLIVQGESFDFYITSYKDWLPSESARRDVTAPLVHSRVIYGSKVLGVAAVNLSLLDDSVAAPYRDVYNTTISKQPDAGSNWDVYVDDTRLTYIKESCVGNDYARPFFLHVTMDDIDDVPDHIRRDDRVARNFDFDFDRFGVRFDGWCMAVVPLPSDGVSGVRTGQFISEGELWGVAINIRDGGEGAYRAEYESVIGETPAIESDFDIHLRDNRLIYTRNSCDASDVEAEFFLQVVPVDIDDLPMPRRESGFDDLDFVFETRGLMFDGMCVASIGLPNYGIDRIRTGQSTVDMVLWEGNYNTSAAAELSALVSDLRGVGVEPVVSSHFDVYLYGGRLIYFRSSCTGEDAEMPFFVHVHPVDGYDLPPDRRSFGFESFGFDLLDDGVMSGDGCFTSFDLPDYEVAGFATGQFVRGEGNVWNDGHSFAAAELPSVVDRLLGSGAEPVVRSYFDIYLDDGRLIYVRDSCVSSDIEAEFFLHIVPLDVNDLPLNRRGSGFENQDFAFDVHGLMLDGMCVASAGLPDYDIKLIRAGQWDSERQRDIWREEFEFGVE